MVSISQRNEGMRVQAEPPLRVICGLGSVKAGKVVVGITEEGEVCRVSFLHGQALGDVVHQWQREWGGTRFEKGRIPKDFLTFPLLEVGTELQRLAWLEIMTIPYGEVVTYGEIAERIGMPGRARAVGRACKMSHLAWVVPCHRVIGAQGLGGFGVDGTVMKEALLAAEGLVLGKVRK